MDYDSAKQWFKQKPFHPFRVYVKDGRTYDVRHRNMNLVAETYVKIGIPDLTGSRPICDHTEYVALKQIDRIEPLATVEASLSN